MKRKRIIGLVLCLTCLFSVSLLSGCSTSSNTPVIDDGDEDKDDDNTGDEDTGDNKDDEEETKPKENIYLAKSLKTDKKVTSNVDGVTAYGEYFAPTTNDLSSYDFSSSYELLSSLTISDLTKLPSSDKLPVGYDMDALIEDGKKSTLNLDILHKYGFTGKGTTAAYIDTVPGPHEEYSNRDNIHIDYICEPIIQIHGGTVLSILAGKNIGVAPDLDLYYYGTTGYPDSEIEAIDKILEHNETCPEDEKIWSIGFSDGLGDDASGILTEAVNKCIKQGIIVWINDLTDFICLPSKAIPFSDKNNPHNFYKPDFFASVNGSNSIWAPGGGGSYAYNISRKIPTNVENHYTYWSTGGVSWAMPYLFGLTSQAKTIDKSLTRDDIIRILKETSDKNINGMSNVFNPVNFITTILKKVGRDDEANAILQEVNNRYEYSYALINSNKISEEDYNSIVNYIYSLAKEDVYIVDTYNLNAANSIYSFLKEDKEKRGGILKGIQIYGDSLIVPSFDVHYKVDLDDGTIDDMGNFKSDLFYQNFNNSVDIMNEFNAMDFHNKIDEISLKPEWKVARLMLPKDEFKDYFKNYNEYINDTAGNKLDLCGFSNPIFPWANNGRETRDGVLRFIKTLDNKYNLIDTDYHLYGNLDGTYTVNVDVEGNFDTENLKKSNKIAPYEYFIYSHGQQNNIDKCVFSGNESVRSSFLSSDTVDDTLGSNYYFFNTFTCNNALTLSNNLIEKALSGKCLGAFSASTSIANAMSVHNYYYEDCSEEDMKYIGYNSFYYKYFLSLHNGLNRSDSFFESQKYYADTLISELKDDLIMYGPEFNLYNLFATHNLGVFENSYETSKMVGISKLNSYEGGADGDDSYEIDYNLTSGKLVGKEYELSSRFIEGNQTIIKSFTLKYQALDNGYVRFSLTYFNDSKDIAFSFFDPPNGDTFMVIVSLPGSISTCALKFDLKISFLSSIKEVTMSFRIGNLVAFYGIYGNSFAALVSNLERYK